MGLALSVEMTRASPAAIKRREKQKLKRGEMHRRGGAGKRDPVQLETRVKPGESVV